MGILPEKPTPSLQVHRLSALFYGEDDIETLTALPQITSNGDGWCFSYYPDDDSLSDRYPMWRKALILFVTSWMTLAATFSSTCIFPASPEISKDFGVSVEVVSSSNAGTLIAMGLSPFIWGPLTSVFGRKSAYSLAISISIICSTGAALSKNFATLIAMQTIGGFEASWFMICGQAVLADIFRPETRGTAIGFFMAGTAVGRGLGPCIGGIIVTYVSWRVIFWLQVFMTGLGLILSLLFVPPEDRPLPQVARSTAAQFSPMRVIELLIYPNILFTDISYGLLSWVMYTILASPRSVINPRFGLTTPLVSGLFYIAPGIGLVVGTTFGGKWADITVCRYIIKRNGKRIPQDRLNSGILSFFVIAPFSLILYGWSLQERFGGLALPSIAIFFTSIGLMVGSSSLNTYCTEVMPNKRTEVMAGKYFIQYTLSAAGNATALPLISLTGVGVSCTLEAVIIIIGGLLIFATTRRGSHMQNWIERIKEGNVNEDLKVSEKMGEY